MILASIFRDFFAKDLLNFPFNTINFCSYSLLIGFFIIVWEINNRWSRSNDCLLEDHLVSFFFHLILLNIYRFLCCKNAFNRGEQTSYFSLNRIVSGISRRTSTRRSQVIASWIAGSHRSYPCYNLEQRPRNGHIDRERHRVERCVRSMSRGLSTKRICSLACADVTVARALK